MDMFSRNIKFWGDEKQKILANSSILIAGVGGLGCTIAEALTRSGIGKLILIDKDIVEISNLNRQILYDNNDIGKSKVEVAKQKLKAINSNLNVPAGSRHSMTSARRTLHCSAPISEIIYFSSDRNEGKGKNSGLSRNQ